MFKIIKEGTSLGMTEAPTYVRQAENGCFVLCREAQATGIAYGGTVYHLLGREAVEGAESVILEETDAGEEIERTATTNGIVFTTMAEAGNIDDVTAAEHADLFSPWAYPVNYTAGQIRRYTDGKLYKCLQAHTSQQDWTPEEAPSLWAKILPGQSGEIGEWEQPDSTNPYMKGDTVTHNGKTWESLVDNNVWEPGATGTESLWKEVTG